MVNLVLIKWSLLASLGSQLESATIHTFLTATYIQCTLFIRVVYLPISALLSLLLPCLQVDSRDSPFPAVPSLLFPCMERRSQSLDTKDQCVTYSTLAEWLVSWQKIYPQWLISYVIYQEEMLAVNIYWFWLCEWKVMQYFLFHIILKYYWLL